MTAKEFLASKIDELSAKVRAAKDDDAVAVVTVEALQFFADVVDMAHRHGVTDDPVEIVKRMVRQ